MIQKFNSSKEIIINHKVKVDECIADEISEIK